ncbi:S1/P1 Nuclease [Phenylobacterium sp. J426]|uniref:S1/P1 Nuclease n=1 Tax=Phenylobacterium sp. J426 TaxID=2898439 RepID=UPI00215095FB|nr:S1/P1 Nuclease [Phenylobacterium sp. J426]MCR5876086.1 S1/P1 Nuclease [Phenylobacterium sp. J426]
MKRILPLALAAAVAVSPATAFAWGGTGHRIVGQLAAKALPSDLPAFLRSKAGVEAIGELSREPDRSKGAGKIHDNDRDAAHFVDIHDDGTILGGPPFLPMPATKAEYETQLAAHQLDTAKAGYLHYAIIDRWQQLALDFAYWRVLTAAEKNPKWKSNHAWFRADRIRREALILATIGDLSHFVGDGAQPLHTSTHYNGWGDYPNPQGFTTARIHSPFESAMVRATADAAAVAAKMTPFRACDCAVEQRTVDYILATNRFVVPLYELEKAGGLAQGDPRGPAFATERMAAGASELRDMIVEAWNASATRSVGWRPVAVQDVLSGKVDPYPSLYSID